MRFQIIAAFLPVLVALVNGFDLKCTATTGGLAMIGSIYYCQVESLTITSQNERITSVNGVTTPTTFQGMFFSGLTVHYLPKGLGKFFPNLIDLLVDFCDLKSIEATDLENLTALESLIIRNNDIEELSSDLFKFTPNIRTVSFYGNKIARVGKDLLSNPKSLSKVYFGGNKCIDYVIPNFEEVKNTLRTQCPAPFKELCSEDFKRYEKEIGELKGVIARQNLDSSAQLLQISSLKVEVSDLKKLHRP